MSKNKPRITIELEPDDIDIRDEFKEMVTASGSDMRTVLTGLIKGFINSGGTYSGIDSDKLPVKDLEYLSDLFGNAGYAVRSAVRGYTDLRWRYLEGLQGKFDENELRVIADVVQRSGFHSGHAGNPMVLAAEARQVVRPEHGVNVGFYEKIEKLSPGQSYFIQEEIHRVGAEGFGVFLEKYAGV